MQQDYIQFEYITRCQINNTILIRYPRYIHYRGSLSDPTTGILTYSFDLKYTINVSKNNSAT